MEESRVIPMRENVQSAWGGREQSEEFEVVVVVVGVLVGDKLRAMTSPVKL